MARFPEAEIERLKAEVSLVSLVQAHGVVLRKVGKDMVGSCPFHDDASPSLVVTPAKNLWHCMGECQAGGGVVDWVMRAQGVSFRHAVELLRDGMPATASSSTAGAGAPKRSTVRTLSAPVQQSAEDGELLAQVVAFYARVLTESPEALEFLRRRKIAHPEALSTFQLGYANRTLGLRLPDKRRTAGADLRGRLTTLGVFRSSGHEHLTGSLVVPAGPAGCSMRCTRTSPAAANARRARSRPDPVHPPATARGPRVRRHPAQGPPRPPGRPRTRHPTPARGGRLLLRAGLAPHRHRRSGPARLARPGHPQPRHPRPAGREPD